MACSCPLPYLLYFASDRNQTATGKAELYVSLGGTCRTYAILSEFGNGLLTGMLMQDVLEVVLPEITPPCTQGIPSAPRGAQLPEEDGIENEDLSQLSKGRSQGQA